MRMCSDSLIQGCFMIIGITGYLPQNLIHNDKGVDKIGTEERIALNFLCHIHYK